MRAKQDPFKFVANNTVACQRGGVSNEPLGQRHVRHLTISKLDNYLDKNFKKERIALLIRLFY